MPTVLVTGAGGACGIGTIQSLQSETTHQVVGVDMDPTAVGIQFADDGMEVPAATDASWPEAIAKIVDECDIDVVVPTVDEELAVLPSLSRELPDDIGIVAPDQEVIDLAMDKYQTMRRLSAAGHPVPETWLATEHATINPSAFPLIVKPRGGRGSRGVQQVDDPEALSAHLAATPYEPEELLCQECIDGTEYTTSVIGTTDNQLLGVVPKEAIEKNGSTVLGATRRAPNVVEACTDLFDMLEPAGPLNIQQIVDNDGTPYVIEINPRFSSTSCLTVDAGINEFDLLIRDTLGESVDSPGSFETDRYIIRYEAHTFVDGADLTGSKTFSLESAKLNMSQS